MASFQNSDDVNQPLLDRQKLRRIECDLKSGLAVGRSQCLSLHYKEWLLFAFKWTPAIHGVGTRPSLATTDKHIFAQQ